MDPRCRIGKIKPKANLVLLPPPDDACELTAKFLSEARRLASMAHKPMLGFAIVAFSETNSVATVEVADDYPVLPSMIPAVVTEVLRLHVTRDILEPSEPRDDTSPA